MTNTLIPSIPASDNRGLSDVRDVKTRSAHYARQARAKRTMKAYTMAWREFTDWCASQRPARQALPADAITVADYAAASADAGAKVSTIKLHLAAISEAHKKAGQPNPTTTEHVRDTVAGIAKASNYAPTKKAALTTNSLMLIKRTMNPIRIEDIRDWSILTLGVAIAARRTELRNLNVDDLRFLPDRLIVQLHATKTGEAEINVPRLDSALCPVRALRAWLDESGITTGAVYRAIRRLNGLAYISDHAFDRDGRAIAEIVKRRAAAIGVDVSEISGHSLRRGFMTSATVDLSARMRVSRHKSHDVAASYVDDQVQMDAIRSAFANTNTNTNKTKK